MKQELIIWLKSQQPILDQILHDAAADYFEINGQKPNFAFDLAECQSESFNLISGKDLCYDRFNTAFAYSLWYHARRVNTFLSFFSESLMNSYEPQIEIFDLGAGTGAVQWAIGLIVAGMKHLNIHAPKITLINVDSSPLMLNYGRDYLWKHFVKQYPVCNDESFAVKYSINSWNNSENISLSNTWVASSYLFDMSDNKDEIVRSFYHIVDTLKPTNLLLLTSDQNKKREFLEEVASKLISQGYAKKFYSVSASLLFKGPLEKVNSFRRKLGSQFQAKAISNSATWDDKSFIGLALTKQQTTLSLSTGVKLFTVSEKDRTKISLSTDQIKASVPTGKPTVIVGPAGCGKSVVLTERIKNIVEAHNYDPNLKILLTTFNKDLVKYLGDWLEQLLDSGRSKREFTEYNGKRQAHSHFRFEGSSMYNISVLHFDVLPTRLGGIKAKQLMSTTSYDIEKFHLELLEELSTESSAHSTLTKKDLEVVASADFLFDEYNRVIYGQQCTNYNSYKSVERVGRGVPMLRSNSAKRKFVWDVLIKYVKYLKANNLDSFTLRRYKFLQKLKSNNSIKKFQYVFVDELQDCTDADYEIFYRLVTDPNNIILAGDLAQSIRIGSTSRIPRASDDRMKRFDRVVLEGSYRLPFRISEAIIDFSRKINSKRSKAGNDQNGNVISPFKGSPPGARPIIVYAATWGEMIAKVKAIVSTYKPFGFNTISVFEKDQELCNKLIQNGINATQETILKAKGLEKQCVLWSTRVPVDTEKEVDEFVYTILTRTASLLIIALCNKVSLDYVEILTTFNQERLIFWDEISKIKYKEICALDSIIEEEYEDTSEEYVGGDEDEELIIYD